MQRLLWLDEDRNLAVMPCAHEQGHARSFKIKSAMWRKISQHTPTWMPINTLTLSPYNLDICRNQHSTNMQGATLTTPQSVIPLTMGGQEGTA
jgi:hypothetical protein